MSARQHSIGCWPQYIAGSGAMPNGVFRNYSALAKPKQMAGAIFCEPPRLRPTPSCGDFTWSTRSTNFVTAFCSDGARQRC